MKAVGYRRFLWLLGLMAVIFILDLATKEYAEQHWFGGQSLNWLSWGSLQGDLTYVQNRGTAMGFLSSMPWLLNPVRAVIVLIAFWMALRTTYKIRAFALGLVAAGGFANLIEVLNRGYVIDMIYFYWLPYTGVPVFNVADIAISLGVLLLFVVHD